MHRILHQPQLYNLCTDPSEKTNVANEHPQEVERLSKLLETVKKGI